MLEPPYFCCFVYGCSEIETNCDANEADEPTSQRGRRANGAGDAEFAEADKAYEAEPNDADEAEADGPMI